MQHTIRLLTCFTVLLLVNACSDKPDCGISLDQVTVLSSQTVKGTTYHWVKRITGFQEKVVFYEVYDQTPEFDACRQPLTPAMAADSIIDHNAQGESQYPVAVIYAANTQDLRIQYQQGDRKNTSPTLTISN